MSIFGLDKSPHSRHQKAYGELVEYIDAGNSLSLEKVLQVGLKHVRRNSHNAQAFVALRLDDCDCNPTTGYTCPKCAKSRPDSRGNTPRSARSSSSRSPRPRGFKTQLARDLEAKYVEEGLKPEYSVYAVALAFNDIAPEQVLIDHRPSVLA